METLRVRREPPPFREVEVSAVEPRSAYMTRITLAGPALAGFDAGLPAASLRLLLPDDTGTLTVPTWDGNEFLRNDGSRPIIRTVTPLRFNTNPLSIDVDVVDHGAGPLSMWADRAALGDGVAMSGTGRGYDIDPLARSYLLAGDESALPALGEVLNALPSEAAVEVFVEVRHLDARLDLPAHPGASVHWLQVTDGAPPGDSLVIALKGATLLSDVRVWAAGEAAAMQRIRRHLSDERELPRSRVVVRGYWKHGRRRDSGAKTAGDQPD